MTDISADTPAMVVQLELLEQSIRYLLSRYIPGSHLDRVTEEIVGDPHLSLLVDAARASGRAHAAVDIAAEAASCRFGSWDHHDTAMTAYGIAARIARGTA